MSRTRLCRDIPTGYRPITIQIVAECDCGNCNAAYLKAESNQNPYIEGAKGYIGRVESRTVEAFGITVTLDEHEPDSNGQQHLIVRFQGIGEAARCCTTI